jgi:membrane protein DedA with SNARE-associated domain
MLFTFIGAGIWNIILAIIGFYLYAVREQIFPYLGHILVGVGVIFVVYLIIKAKRNGKKS